MKEIIRLENVCKSFGGVKALNQVNLTVFEGECLALVGENGAGKSTLMKIVSGVYPTHTFSGKIYVDQKPVFFDSPLAAEQAGISIIHQELSNFAHLTVAENIFVGHWPQKNHVIAWKSLLEQATYWLRKIGCDCDPKAKMGSLSVGTQQMVEIAKALSKETRLLILDEPTSALSPAEVDKLYLLISDLKKQKKGLVYISHKMEEIYQVCDRMSILRDGQSVANAPISEMPEELAITHMVGRSLNQIFPIRQRTAAWESLNKSNTTPLLELKNFKANYIKADRKRIIGPINLQIKAGEIVGLAGLLGAGRSELVQAIFGDGQFEVEGEVKVNGKLVKINSPQAAWKQGLALVGEDRKHDSILPQRDLEENASISRLMGKKLFRKLNLKDEYKKAIASFKSLELRYHNTSQVIESLSGGNQQKVILARALQTKPEVILLDEPTRGVDVGAKYEIYEILFALANQGKALIIVSSHLPEIMALCDRIVVLHEGQDQGTLEQSQFNQEQILRLAIGRKAATHE